MFGLTLTVRRSTASMATFGLCLALYFALSAMATTIVQRKSDAPSTGPYSFSGVVLNDATGEPVPRAVVQIGASFTRATFADSEGHFEFTDLPEVQAAIYAAKPGFFPFERTQTIQIGPKTDAVVLKLSPEASIVGTVEADGEPVEKLPIQVYASQVINGRRQMSLISTTDTDEDGLFRVKALRPGNYYLAAGPSAMGQETIAANAEVYPETFYPGVGEISSAGTIQVLAGQQAQATIKLQPETPVEISGTVIGAAHSDDVRMQIFGWASYALPWSIHCEANTGKFSTRLLPGRYKLRAYSQATGQNMVGERELNVTANMAGITISLAPLASIPVVFRQETSGQQERQLPIVGLAGKQMPYGPAATIYARPIRGTGNFVIDGIFPGTYRLQANSHNTWYVQSASSGGIDLLHEDLVMTQDTMPAPIEIGVRGDGATLRGAISSEGKGVPGVVVLVSENANHDITSMPTAEDGRFVVQGIAPGDYSLLAFDRLDQVEYMNPEVLSGYLSKANHVTLQPNQTLEINPTLIQGGR